MKTAVSVLLAIVLAAYCGSTCSAAEVGKLKPKPKPISLGQIVKALSRVARPTKDNTWDPTAAATANEWLKKNIVGRMLKTSGEFWSLLEEPDGSLVAVLMIPPGRYKNVLYRTATHTAKFKPEWKEKLGALKEPVFEKRKDGGKGRKKVSGSRITVTGEITTAYFATVLSKGRKPVAALSIQIADSSLVPKVKKK